MSPVSIKFHVENFYELKLTNELSYDGNNFTPAGSSQFKHSYTLGLANYKGKALTTGCNDSSSCYIKTELMDMSTLQWSNGPDYPFASS